MTKRTIEEYDENAALYRGIEKLHREIVAFGTDKQDLTSHLESVKQENSTLVVCNNRLIKEVEKLQSENAALKEQVMAEKSVYPERATNPNERSVIQCFREELKRWEGHCASIEATMKIFQDENARLIQRNEELEPEVREERAKVKELSDRVLFLQGHNNIGLPQLKDILDKSVQCVECHAAISGALESYLPQGIAKTFHYGKDCSCDNCKRVRESATIGNQNNLIDGLPKE